MIETPWLFLTHWEAEIKSKIRRRSILLTGLVLFLLTSLVVGCSQPSVSAPPVITEFRANPTEIISGESTTLLWSVTGVTTVTIDQGIGDVPKGGTQLVSPTTTTAYTLTAINNGGIVTKAVVITVIPPAQVPTKSKLKVHFIDVGQGDSILIDFGDIEMLIDGGNRSPGVVAYLNDYVDGSIETLVATHPHADHIGGLIAALVEFDVDDIWLNGDTSTSQTYTEFMSTVNAEGAKVHIAKRGDQIEVGNFVLDVLNPTQALLGTTNNNSIVLLLSYGDVDFLFTGDAEAEAEASMIASLLIPDVNVLKVGHHGSRTASSKPFIEVARPEIAIYMAGEGNSYGHPHDETIIALSEAEADIYGTDVHGTIVITTDGRTYELQLEKPGPPLELSVSTTEPATKPPVQPPPTTSINTNIQITRIFYDGQVYRVESDEYVEITNLGDEPQSLAGWILRDIGEGYPSFTFPSYILEPGESIRVYTNEIHPEYGGFSFGFGKAVWNNRSPDTAALYDDQGREVSRKSY